MSAALPKQADCCSPCDSSSGSGGGQGPVGPAGPAGPAGAAGEDGINAFSALTAQFVMPAVNVTDTATVDDSSWMAIGQIIFLEGGGYLEVTAKPSAVQVTLENLGFPSNSAPTTVVPVASQISPAGERGDTGSPAPSSDLNDISPTTTRGDLMVDNGANSPLANVVRLPVGTDGQALTANSAQPTGVQWNTVLPNVATDNAIVRFNGAAGNPVPGQTSSMVVTDDGALQSSPTGGNARGSRAVDLQVERAGATQVASGANSVITGGKNNTASGANAYVGGGETNDASNTNAGISCGKENIASGVESHVGGGFGNTASGADSSVAGGENNLASASSAAVCAGTGNSSTSVRAFVGGGNANTASADSASVVAGSDNVASAASAFVGGGNNNSATGPRSSILGGQQALADKHGQIAHSAGQFGAQGDCQASFLHWRIATTDATANVEMFLDGAALRAAIPSGASWAFHLIIVGRSSAGVDAMWETKGLVKNNAGTTSLTGSVTQAVIADGTGGTWGVSGNVVVDADNANDALRIRVTGAAVTNIRWHAHARIVEINF